MHAPANLDVPRRPRGDRARIGRDDRVIGKQVVDMPGDDLRLERDVVALFAGLHQVPPFLHPVLSRLQERSILTPLQQRQERFQRRPGVAAEPDVDRIAEPQPCGVPVDLHRFRLPGLGR